MPTSSRPGEPRVPDAPARSWAAVEGPDARTVQVPVVPPAPRKTRRIIAVGSATPAASAAERRARVQAHQSEQLKARERRAEARPVSGEVRPVSSEVRPVSGEVRPRVPGAPLPTAPAAERAPAGPAHALAAIRARLSRTPDATAAATTPVEARPRSSSRPSQRRGPATGSVRIPKGRGSSRPGGPSAHARGPEVRNRIEAVKPRGSWLTAASWRLAVLAGVLVLAAAVVLPSLRSYFRQQEELAALAAEAQAATVEVEELRAEAARWDDPAYVVAQARERLAFVFPGETPYRVIDPETVAGAAEGSPAAEEQATGAEDGTWYTRLWGSIAGPEALLPEYTDGAEETSTTGAGASPAPVADASSTPTGTAGTGAD